MAGAEKRRRRWTRHPHLAAGVHGHAARRQGLAGTRRHPLQTKNQFGVHRAGHCDVRRRCSGAGASLKLSG